MTVFLRFSKVSQWSAGCRPHFPGRGGRPLPLDELELDVDAPPRAAWSLMRRNASSAAVNADSIFPTCAEVKFPSWRVPVISRLGDRLLHALVADRGGAAVVVGLAR